MADFLIAIGAAILTVVGIACVAVAAGVAFACLLPASYLAALMLTLRSARPEPEPEPAGDPDGANGAPLADTGTSDYDPPHDPPSGDDIRKDAGEILRLRFASQSPPPRRLALPGPPPVNFPQAALTRPRPANRARPPAQPVYAPRAAVRESGDERSHADRLMAIPSYFFGPVTDDLRYVVRMGIRNCRLCLAAGKDLASSALESDLSIFSLMAGLGIFAGLGIGGLIGAAVVTVMGLVNLLVVLITVLVALGAWGLFRAVDRARRAVANVRMVCTACGDKVRGYPMYRCPGCAELHTDIRPGPYGVISRWCRCETRLPTSLLFGAGRLAAICPSCAAGLPDGFGRIPDMAIPFFGAVNVGKTQLMHRLVEAFQELAAANGATVTFQGDAKERLDRLTAGGRPTKTPRGSGSPIGYTLLFTLGSMQRLISLFDAAGELHYSREDLARLKYLGHARVLVFVADPLAADGVWEKIPVDLRDELARMKIRSTKRDIDIAYEKTREQMRELGIKAKFARLAFVVSKADVLKDAGLPISAIRGTSVSDWVSDSDGLDMADEVREARQGFAAVEFFRTAAVMQGDSPWDRSVEVLAQWLLWSEGIRLKEWESDGP